ncbi:MAG: hypothetical protein D6702_02745 [Planctomycetota bacterium]|nr:MAG: hypothetical protein D6702_02745 [Planctomycetota bacterium]
MASFTGQSEHKLDDKGRLFLPRRILDAVEDPEERHRFILMAGPDPCVYLLTVSAFRERYRNLKRDLRGHQDYVQVMRGLSRLLSEERLDGQGRLLIPPYLRDKAGLGRKVVVVGVFEMVEIWDAEAWNSDTMPAAEEAFHRHSGSFFNFGQSDDPDEGRP